jgi:hypothetical protein
LNWQPGEAGLVGWLLQTNVLIMISFANPLLENGPVPGPGACANRSTVGPNIARRQQDIRVCLRD